MQMLAANYAKLSTTMTTPSGARTRGRMDIRDITCFKCDNKNHYTRDCVAERTNHRNEVSTQGTKQESEAQYVELMECENKVYHITNRYQLYNRTRADRKTGPVWEGRLRNHTTDARAEKIQDPMIEGEAQVEELPTTPEEPEEIAVDEGIRQIEVDEELGQEERARRLTDQKKRQTKPSYYETS
ncbi:11351_t:CDS:2 [Acaulospora morrowiae]|uniref:11351_t:CDS:1 n=1 Tax=Acaulospora morrowiae TaxID=94023 RepID=A0A9N9FXE9_9GLOM|nr:11351_t:CDS:2 [Acaulospora morrowiae]